jgi:D-alanyl-D-alanine carboxypeptidase
MTDQLRLDAWLDAATEYVGKWIEFQMKEVDQPGCVVAIVHDSQVVFEMTFGVADRETGEPLTARHRFRAASHSKTFTAAGILKLKAEGRLRLDDTVGTIVAGLHPQIAAVTLRQLLSHSAGISRDGRSSGYFADQRPFLSAAELTDELKESPAIEAGLRFKYSNHGYGLLGLVIEAVTQEPFDAWIAQEVIAPAGLVEMTPDVTTDDHALLARGHTARRPLGYRCVIPGDNRTNGLACVTGLTSTASDLARFFAQLSPNAESSILSPELRRDMTRPHWRDQDSAIGRSSGLGVHSGQIVGWEYFGHVGRFQGSVTRTAVFPVIGVSIAILTNAIDGPAVPWLDGVVHILRRFRQGGAPPIENASWNGRWWNLWRAIDLVAVGATIQMFNPALYPPFHEASEITLSEADRGLVTRAPAMERFGEPVARLRDRQGAVAGVRIGGASFGAEEAVSTHVQSRYGAKVS